MTKHDLGICECQPGCKAKYDPLSGIPIRPDALPFESEPGELRCPSCMYAPGMCESCRKELGSGGYESSEQYNITVDHPAHYNWHPAGIECIDVVEAFNFNIGNAIKYLWRYGRKPGVSAVEDLDKAIWYLQRERERING